MRDLGRQQGVSGPIKLASPGRPGRPGAGADTGALRPTDVVAAFFICAIVFLLAAVIAGAWQGLSPWPWGRWLALHLAFLGGVSQLVLGASQFFAAAFLATDPPPRRLIRAQLILWNLGVITLAIAAPLGLGELRWLAAALLLTGLGAWGLAITAIRGGAVRQFSWATRWYVGGAAFLAVGILAGSLIAAGHYPGGGNLLAAHMALNILGWFGGAIVGTLHTFYPSLTGTQLTFPRLQLPTFAAWTGGVAAIAVGYTLALDPITTLGWFGLTVASTLLLVNLAGCLRRASIPLSLPARLLTAAQVFLVAGIALIFVLCLVNGPANAISGSWRDVIGTLLVSGWIGLTVLGSMLHLLAVVIRVRAGFFAPMPKPRPRPDLALTVLAFLAVAVLAVGQAVEGSSWPPFAAAVLVATYLILGAQTAIRAARVITSARPTF